MNNPIIEYWPNGRVESAKYYSDGEIHRDPLEGPALIWYDVHGKIETKYYLFKGKFHNPYGPAWIDIVDEYYGIEWWFDGKPYNYEVNEYLNTNNLDYKTMTHIDFDIMWTCIL